MSILPLFAAIAFAAGTPTLPERFADTSVRIRRSASGRSSASTSLVIIFR